MWFVDDCSQLDTFNWSPKGPSIASGEKKVFHDKISAYPIKLNGYDDYFPIATEGSTILLNTKIDHFDAKTKTFTIKGEKLKFDIVINTLADLLFDYVYGELPFVGVDFYPFILPVKEAFPKDIFFILCRKRKSQEGIEYKKLIRYKNSKNTLLGLEVPLFE